LSPDVQANVQASLVRTYGPELNTSFAENSALIGGMRITVASDVYDGSIKAGLAALENSF
jgi:F0F1-type ATP synthase delta subunit